MPVFNNASCLSDNEAKLIEALVALVHVAIDAIRNSYRVR